MPARFRILSRPLAPCGDSCPLMKCAWVQLGDQHPSRHGRVKLGGLDRSIEHEGGSTASVNPVKKVEVRSVAARRRRWLASSALGGAPVGAGHLVWPKSRRRDQARRNIDCHLVLAPRPATVGTSGRSWSPDRPYTPFLALILVAARNAGIVRSPKPSPAPAQTRRVHRHRWRCGRRAVAPTEESPPQRRAVKP